MATIEENLTKLVNAKTAIANAITAKGGTVSQGDGFEDFATDIESIGNVCDKLITDNQSVTTSDIYICDSGMYIYLFGYVETTAGTNCVFTAYNFAMSRISVTYQALYANRNTGATTSIGTPTINTSNNTIEFYCPKGRYDYYYAFTKKA